MLLVFISLGLFLLSETLGPKRERRKGYKGLLVWSCFGCGAVYSGALSVMLGVVEDAFDPISS